MKSTFIPSLESSRRLDSFFRLGQWNSLMTAILIPPSANHLSRPDAYHFQEWLHKTENVIEDCHHPTPIMTIVDYFDKIKWIKNRFYRDDIVNNKIIVKIWIVIKFDLETIARGIRHALSIRFRLNRIFSDAIARTKCHHFFYWILPKLQVYFFIHEFDSYLRNKQWE